MEPGYLLHSAFTCQSSGNACISNRDTNLYLVQNNSSVHLTTITEMQCTKRINRHRTGFGRFRSYETTWATKQHTKQHELLNNIRNNMNNTTWQHETTYETTWNNTSSKRNSSFRSCLHKWSMAASATCEWRHVFMQCPIRPPPHRLHGLTVSDDETMHWLLNMCPEI